jgi:hypothetical protein
MSRSLPQEGARAGPGAGPWCPWDGPQVPPEGLREDAAVLFQAIREAHPAPFAYLPEARFAEALRELGLALRGPLTARGSYRLLAPAVSSLRSGHTFVLRLETFDQRLQAGGRILPIGLEWDGERAWLAAHHGVSSAPVGATIREINGEEAAEVIRRIGRYVPQEGRESNPWLVRREDWLWYWLWIEYGDAECLELAIRWPQGREGLYRVPAVSLADLGGDPRQARPDHAVRDLPEAAAVILECNLFGDPERFAAALEPTFARLRERAIPNLIVDLRRCRGGTSAAAEALLGYLVPVPFLLHAEVRTRASRLSPAVGAAAGTWRVDRPVPVVPLRPALRYAGKVVALIGPLTYSLGVSCAHALRNYAGALLVGEVSADSTASSGGQQPFRLPHSGLTVGIATQSIVCPGAEAGGAPLTPDAQVRPAPEDTAHGVDTALRQAARVLTGGAGCSRRG